ncbi:Ig-like domain-containing protein, partial [Escherichia coli]|uniref:Ig-like domain-containing protein n=2 Tax=Bacteria TaxID=2 RepID=UPI00321A223E
SVDDPEGNIVSYQLGVPPFNGTAVINQDGTFTYTPNPDFVGEDIFDVIVTDSNGTQGVGTVIVTVLASSSAILAMDSEVAGEFNMPV